MYKYGESFNEAIEKLMKFNEYFIKKGSFPATISNKRFKELQKSSYLNKELIIPG